MLDELFSDIGGKLKGLAKCVFVIEAIGAILSGGGYMIGGVTNADVGMLALVVGPAIAIGGVIVAWVSAWFLYGFGELIEKACNISDKLDVMADPVTKEQKHVEEEERECADREAQELRAKKDAERKPQNRRPVTSAQSATGAAVTKKPSDLKEHLEYALKFETDYGMICYLQSVDDEKVEKILELPEEEVRAATEQLRNSL